MMKIIYENRYGLKVFNYFRKKIPSEIFDWVLNTPLTFKIFRKKFQKFV